MQSTDTRHMSRTILDGRDRAPARSYLRGMGFSEEDLNKPIVGVAHSWIETMPCNFNHRHLAEKVKEGIREAGGTSRCCSRARSSPRENGRCARPCAPWAWARSSGSIAILGIEPREVVSATAVWYSTGLPAAPLRWVLIRDLREEFESQALLCTDLDAKPERIISWFARRWRMETTFQEARQRLGFESQRH